jgi:hypothetical protein
MARLAVTMLLGWLMFSWVEQARFVGGDQYLGRLILALCALWYLLTWVEKGRAETVRIQLEEWQERQAREQRETPQSAAAVRKREN